MLVDLLTQQKNKETTLMVDTQSCSFLCDSGGVNV